jgi:GT2 family glycosyltransferase
VANPSSDTGSPAISVVLATRDRSELLALMLDGLTRQTIGAAAFEVVVVDDASRDDTAALLAARSAELNLRVLRNETSQGPATARDVGWREARAELVAFTDDDCVPSPGWLEALLEAARATPGGVVMGRTTPDPAGRQTPFTRSLLVERAGPPFQTCNIVYPRSLLERLGGFDRRYPLPVAEDTDLGWRAVQSGAPLAFAADALVHHAVHELGPLGNLRMAMKWRAAAPLFKRHPELRKVQLHRGIFWSPTHEHLLRALLAAALPRRLWPLSLWLAFPYLRRLAWRRSGPLLAPYILVYDLVETAAVVRGAIDESVPLI